jgi:hypothetical protein
MTEEQEYDVFCHKFDRVTKGGTYLRWGVVTMVLPRYSTNRLVAKHLIPLFPTSYGEFDASVLADYSVACVVAKHCAFCVCVPSFKYALTSIPFIDYVFREAPAYSHHIPDTEKKTAAFTPALIEYVMQKIKLGIYSQKLMKQIPGMKRRRYARNKLREYEHFVLLIHYDRRMQGLTTDLQRLVGNYLNLATSRAWRQILHLVTTHIY